MNQPQTSEIKRQKAWRFKTRFQTARPLLVVLAMLASASTKTDAQTNFDQDAADLQAAGFQAAVRESEPLNPVQQKATFALPNGFRISCFASEPDLQKPMNMAFDADGRLWVTGSNQYPTPAAEGEGRDSVRILEDTNGDGRADSVKVFADDLNIPIGLLPYGNGAIVFSIPDILFLEDTNADGIADKRTKLYGPFDTSRDTHGMTNSFTAYHDGWIYACHGFNNQSTVSGSDGHAITMISGNTYRFRPDGSRIEIVTRGQVNPFGMTFDEFGDLFTSDCHSKPVNLLINGGYHESFGKPDDGLGFIPNVMMHQHGSTAIDAVCCYDGSEFPEAFQGNLFLGNVMTGRVHRNRIVRNGATVMMQEERDLVVSSDPWFRPVDIQSGPDGSLYIADFYNRIIGHYEVPLDHPGRDRHRGRIWKVEYVLEEGVAAEDASVAAADQQTAKVPQLTTASLEELLERLNDPRLQVRIKAANLIVTEHSAAASAVRTAWEATSEDSERQSAAHLLWVLHRLKTLQPADLLQAMSNGNSVVRIHAMKVCAEHEFSDSLADNIKVGLRDPDRLVQRAAAGAAAQHASVILLKELVNAMVVCPDQDVHLQHAVKIALRNQLQHDEIVNWFLQNTQPETAYIACSQIIAGLKTNRTAALALSVLRNCSLPQAEATALIGHAARHANTSDANQLVQLASRLPASETRAMVQIRQVLADAFARNQVADFTEFRAFEANLLNRLIEEVDVQKLNWGRYQWDDRPAGEWQLEDRKKSNSGTNRFLSSLPGGESSVSVLRSKSFVVPFQQSIEMCGHMGAPDNAPILDNQLILRETKSGTVLRTQLPPRRDQAVKVSWKLADTVGKRAVLELHDGIDTNSYAWLAIGPVSPAVVNFSKGQQSERQEQLKTVVQILDARSRNGILQDDHLQLLGKVVRAHQVDGGTRQMAAAILFRQRGLNSLAPLSVLLKFGRVPMPVHNQIATACSVDEPWISRIIRKVDLPASSAISFERLPELKPDLKLEDLKTEKSDPFMDRSAWIMETVQSICSDLPEFYGIRVAREMAATKSSAQLLVQAIATGGPSASMLRDQTLANLLKSHGEQLASEVDALVEALPEEKPVPPEYIQAVLRNLKTAPLAGATSVEGQTEAAAPAENSGKVLFDRHCAACHRQNDKGGLVGPQLDGIKTRGPERLLEDILYPHRNVDVAFQTSVVLLKSGKTISGLMRPQDDPKNVSVTMPDGKSKEIFVDEIDKVIQTSQSFMPSGFHDLLSERQMTNLLRWLSRS